MWGVSSVKIFMVVVLSVDCCVIGNNQIKEVNRNLGPNQIKIGGNQNKILYVTVKK